MDSQDQVHVGIVGCGYQGRLLAQAMARTSRLRVVACADPVGDAAAEVAALAGHSHVYASADELLDKSEVDAVKLKVADLIDLLDAMQGSEVDGREVNIAITHLQTASMFAVAALTKGK